MEAESEVFFGSGNVFADLDLTNPEELQLKASLAIEIRRALEEQRLPRKKASLKLGMEVDALTHLLDGRSSEYSIDRLIQILERLDRTVELSVSVRERPLDNAQKAVVVA